MGWYCCNLTPQRCLESYAPFTELEKPTIVVCHRALFTVAAGAVISALLHLSINLQLKCSWIGIGCKLWNGSQKVCKLSILLPFLSSIPSVGCIPNNLLKAPFSDSFFHLICVLLPAHDLQLSPSTAELLKRARWRVLRLLRSTEIQKQWLRFEKRPPHAAMSLARYRCFAQSSRYIKYPKWNADTIPCTEGVAAKGAEPHYYAEHGFMQNNSRWHSI